MVCAFLEPENRSGFGRDGCINYMVSNIQRRENRLCVLCVIFIWCKIIKKFRKTGRQGAFCKNRNWCPVEQKTADLCGFEMFFCCGVFLHTMKFLFIKIFSNFFVFYKKYNLQV